MVNLRAVIVDDEPDAQNLMMHLLRRLGDVEVIGRADSVEIAFDIIVRTDPDIVFLDIQMPEKDGFELVNQLKIHNLTTKVIFVTAHIEYAINAMKVAAFDYLLKPVEFEELKKTLNRYRCENKSETHASKSPGIATGANGPEKLCLNTRTGYIFILTRDVIYCAADVNYSEIYLPNQRKEVVTLNIGRLEQMLDPRIFYRLTRSFLINTTYLVKACRKLQQCELIRGDEKYVIPASAKQIHTLESFINNRSMG